jgi:two-component system, sensor histidine kinase YesM
MNGGLNIINLTSSSRRRVPWNSIRKSLKLRLLIYFILISILPILLVGFIPYQKTSEVVKSQVLEFAQSTVNQLNENINYYLKEMDLMSRMVYYQTFSKEATENGIEHLNADQFRKFLIALKSNRSFIDEIHVVIGKEAYTTAAELKRDKLEGKDWYKYAREHSGEKLWIGPHKNDYSYNQEKMNEVVSLVYSFTPSNTSETACIIVEMKRENLDLLFDNQTLRSLDKILLIDKYGHIIYSTDPKLLSPMEEDSNQYITNTNLLSSIGKENSFIYAINITTGWKVAAFVPNDKIDQSFSSIRNMVFLLIGVFLLISIFLAWGLSNRLIKPLRKLQMDMRQVKKGNFYIRSDINCGDEIGELSVNFNQMVEEIETLVEQISENERRKKKIEMQSLQYQINPHFLYNTLNSVQWLAKLHKVPDISEMLTALIKLLRASLNTTHYTHMLEEELEILSFYSRIQKYRYEDGFQIHFDVNPEALIAEVPRFILQPLVENSFFHGFSDGEGRIDISANFTEEGSLLLTITDNGKGIPEEKRKTILHPSEKKKQSSGIGIKNVDDKIKLYFGQEYGLIIESELERGTSISIVLPYIPKSGGDEISAKSLIS